MSIFTICGSNSGGGGFPTGRLRLIACSWIGMGMMSITSSTSITSISGVVLMSIMTSGSPDLLGPTLIAMMNPLLEVEGCGSAAGLRRRLGDEADLGDARTLRCVDDPPYALVARASVAADLDFRLRGEHRDLLQ